jgi:hypothetical protein
MQIITRISIAIVACFSSCVACGDYVSGTMLHDGIERTYEAYIPTMGPDPDSYPLVIERNKRVRYNI